MPLDEQKDEFDWEQEIRKDEARISAYFAELPRFMDLPSEDEVISSRIRRREDSAVRSGLGARAQSPSGKLPAEFESFLFGEVSEEEEHLMENSDFLKRDGADVYVVCGKVAREFCLLFAETEDSSVKESLLVIFALLGKVMARVADVVYFEPHEMSRLKIALCKRLASDINAILGRIAALRGKDSCQNAPIDFLFSQVQLVRQRILELLAHARHEPPRNFASSGDDD